MSHVFDKADYESGDGMLTSVWGPPLWHFLHTMSFNYPTNPTEKEKKKLYELCKEPGKYITLQTLS